MRRASLSPGFSFSLPSRPRVLMDLSRPRLLISRSPWNFYQFLSSDVPHSSFLKFPRGSRRFFFLISPLYSYCLFMGLPTAPFLSSLSIFTLSLSSFTFILSHTAYALSSFLFSTLSLSLVSDRPLATPTSLYFYLRAFPAASLILHDSRSLYDLFLFRGLSVLLTCPPPLLDPPLESSFAPHQATISDDFSESDLRLPFLYAPDEDPDER